MHRSECIFYHHWISNTILIPFICSCHFHLVIVSHTVQDLVFIWNMTDPLVVNEDIELPQQDISQNFTTDCTIEYSTGNFTCLAVVFNLRRRLGYHLFHTYIPSALIVVMSWISFWIKPEAIPARVTLGVTSLLTLGKTRILLFFSQMLKNSWNSIKIMLLKHTTELVCLLSTLSIASQFRFIDSISWMNKSPFLFSFLFSKFII